MYRLNEGLDGRTSRLPDDSFPGGRLVLAATLSSRLRGMLFSEATDVVLMLAPFRDIHTFGMHAALDVAFVDGFGLVVGVVRDLLPNKRIRNRHAVAVLERYAIPREVWFEVGERISIGVFQEDLMMHAGDNGDRHEIPEEDDRRR